MTISSQDWKNFINKLSKIDQTAGALMEYYIDTHGIDNPEIVNYAYSLTSKYGEAAGALAAEWYDQVAEASGKALPAAEAAEVPEYKEVAKAVNGTKKTGNVKTVANSVGRLVKRTGVDTTMKNAIRDHAEWAWIPNGDTCVFCLTLASNGWQPASESQMHGGHADHIHANCDCTFAVRFDKNTKYSGYDPAKYKQMYDEAEGIRSKDKINAMRRANYAENKDKINAQKRIAYAERKMRNDASTSGPKDITGLFKDNLSKNRSFVTNASEYIAPDGQTYKVNGNNILIDHNEEEKETAALLSRALGEKVELCPRVCGKIEGVETPDYLVGDNKERWDRKGLNGSGKDAMRDAIKRHRGQAENFIVDISNWKGEEKAAIDQIDRVFSSYNTSFVNSVIITKDGEIKKALKR